nr:hypothetical protein [Okeania sp. SIO2F4]
MLYLMGWGVWGVWGVWGGVNIRIININFAQISKKVKKVALIA